MIGYKPSGAAGAGLLEWTGPTNGSQNMQENPILYFVAAPGTYMVTVKRAMSMTWEICGNGGRGGSGGEDVAGGNGGGCGEVRNGNFTMLPGTTYHLGLQGGNVAGNSFIAVLGGPAIVAAGGTSGSSAPAPGVGGLVYPGRPGGGGSGFGQVGDGGGGDGFYSGGYSPGSGGGGGAPSSAYCGPGGSGGGNPGSGNGAPAPGGFVPCCAGAGGRGIGWRVFNIGSGGGGGASCSIYGPWPGGGSPGGWGNGAPGGAVVTFVSVA